MGADVGPEADRLNRAFTDCVRGGTAVVRFPVPGLRWSRGLDGRRALEDFLRPQLPAKRAERRRRPVQRAVPRPGRGRRRGFTDEDIVNHMIFLLMAAHDTTTITMTTMAYYLAKHPEWQQRCRAESLARRQAAPSPTSDIERLVRLDLVMSECMRLVTAVPGRPARRSRTPQMLGYPRAGRQLCLAQHAGHASPRGVLARSRPLRPRAVRRDRREDKVAAQRVDPVRQRRAQMHRAALRRDAGQGGDAPAAARHRWSVPRDYEMPMDWSSLPRPKDGLPIRLERL